MGLISGVFLGSAIELDLHSSVSQAQAQTTPAAKTNDPHFEFEALEGRTADQAHAMVDVGYHFANLWFAADKQNWPLANYYLTETRQHLQWAVRFHPVRKISSGTNVDLNGILEAVDHSFLAGVGQSITNKDSAAFRTAYRQTLEGCYACHKACEKPYLRPQVPTAPGVTIINFDPAATWPE